jgi:hypothetical protein
VPSAISVVNSDFIRTAAQLVRTVPPHYGIDRVNNVIAWVVIAPAHLLGPSPTGYTPGHSLITTKKRACKPFPVTAFQTLHRPRFVTLSSPTISRLSKNGWGVYPNLRLSKIRHFACVCAKPSAITSLRHCFVQLPQNHILTQKPPGARGLLLPTFKPSNLSTFKRASHIRRHAAFKR